MKGSSTHVLVDAFQPLHVLRLASPIASTLDSIHAPLRAWRGVRKGAHKTGFQRSMSAVTKVAGKEKARGGSRIRGGRRRDSH